MLVHYLTSLLYMISFNSQTVVIFILQHNEVSKGPID